MSSPAGLKAAHRGGLEPLRLGVNCRPFHIPRCAQCRAPLADAAGNPRWEVLEERFVCLEQCRPVRPVSRRAALS